MRYALLIAFRQESDKIPYRHTVIMGRLGFMLYPIVIPGTTGMACDLTVSEI